MACAGAAPTNITWATALWSAPVTPADAGFHLALRANRMPRILLHLKFATPPFFPGQQAERLSLASWRHSLRTAVSKTEVDRGLKVVALSYNSLGEATLSLLASVLSLDSSLREVYLRGSCLSSKTSDQLQATLSDNLTIQTVDLRDPGEGSAVGGWLWDATQDPPLIMQNVRSSIHLRYCAPRPLTSHCAIRPSQIIPHCTVPFSSPENHLDTLSHVL